MSHSDEVDWSRLTHAYGPATDVPFLLRSLVGSDEQVRQKAIWELWGTIWHQGTVYPATAPAVPELARIARDVVLPADDRESLVALLAAIAHGQSYLDVHGDFMRSVGSSVDDSDLVRELADVEAAHQAVEREAPCLFAVLAGTDVRIDWRLAQLAAQVPNASQGVLGLLDALETTTTNATLRAAILLTRSLVKGGVRDASVIEAAQELDPDARESLDLSMSDPRVRAQAVVDYLFEQGFDESRVVDADHSTASDIGQR